MSIQPEGLFVGMTTLMEHRSVDAVLLDMDGTILNSIKAAERVWGEWALRHGLDVDAFLPTVHGVQSVETIRRLGLPGVDPVAEAALVHQAETGRASCRASVGQNV